MDEDRTQWLARCDLVYQFMRTLAGEHHPGEDKPYCIILFLLRDAPHPQVVCLQDLAPIPMPAEWRVALDAQWPTRDTVSPAGSPCVEVQVPAIAGATGRGGAAKE